ncbi:ImmA/IrrE family metallo-endopeptidase [Arthrobacter sp. Ld5]|uniref:ImmA/IrrE family metallo-endopeptidase n=1 Tax=Arthrobacter sp. Ld5 TaxID=649152 RepID=UPI003EBDDD00
MTNAIIQGDVLEWALEDAGVDRQAVLTGLHLARRGPLNEHLSGPISVPLDVLKQIAEITHRSAYFFALPHPPEERRKSVKQNFRAPSSNDGTPRQLNPEERAAVRLANRRQEIASKLSRDLNAKPVDLAKVIANNSSPERAAESAATWLQWDRRQQYTVLKSKNKVFVALRQALESRGIMTNLVAVEGDSFRGFSLHHDYAPLIFINASVKSPASRSFTLLHELAHLMRGTDKACDRTDLQSRSSEESWCNRFAAAFLLPASDLSRYLEKNLKQTSVPAGDTYALKRISNYFKVSWYCAAIRLKELGYADNRLVDSVSGDFQDPEEQGRAPGKTRAEIRVTEYGYRFARLFGSALSEAKVSQLEARKLFRLNGAELDQLIKLGRGAD